MRKTNIIFLSISFIDAHKITKKDRQILENYVRNALSGKITFSEVSESVIKVVYWGPEPIFIEQFHQYRVDFNEPNQRTIESAKQVLAR